MPGRWPLIFLHLPRFNREWANTPFLFILLPLLLALFQHQRGPPLLFTCLAGVGIPPLPSFGHVSTAGGGVPLLSLFGRILTAGGRATLIWAFQHQKAGSALPPRLATSRHQKGNPSSSPLLAPFLYRATPPSPFGHVLKPGGEPSTCFEQREVSALTTRFV